MTTNSLDWIKTLLLATGIIYTMGMILSVIIQQITFYMDYQESEFYNWIGKAVLASMVVISVLYVGKAYKRCNNTDITNPYIVRST